jgi:hypothetical protein
MPQLSQNRASSGIATLQLTQDLLILYLTFCHVLRLTRFTFQLSVLFTWRIELLGTNLPSIELPLELHAAVPGF